MMATHSAAKWKLVYMLAQTYALDMLEAVSKKPMRFTDLESHSPNERTRSQRLKDLEDAGLITTISLKINKRYFVHYTATNKGRQVLQKARELADMA
ncbi:putative transcriptional regulator [Candidatus Nitrososphaera evergladensis SR1]|jgi:DNA-binding HxlR family transcriptional regulator|uniref:Putative transcriptional regulator n=1 Tax=Candidatus Nitrososphaera evergladensis SR1 TaxID=1459636 RepID=A0A075MRA5_9ARCH|nr:winged helix-turn-helix transcriptional regulator [Candidatus Nitrososphaera evergladensis]AIF83347.1 putative transcriptional regulator [Candidatus Nitrososphaera evergladensis SR1]